MVEVHSNKYVSSRKVKKERHMLNTIWQRKQRWIEHLLRNKVLLREIIEERTKGKAFRVTKRLYIVYTEWPCIIGYDIWK